MEYFGRNMSKTDRINYKKAKFLLKEKLNIIKTHQLNHCKTSSLYVGKKINGLFAQKLNLQ